jgi:hypothetical protein
MAVGGRCAPARGANGWHGLSARGERTRAPEGDRQDDEQAENTDHQVEDADEIGCYPDGIERVDRKTDDADRDQPRRGREQESDLVEECPAVKAPVTMLETAR